MIFVLVLNARSADNANSVHTEVGHAEPLSHHTLPTVPETYYS